MEFWVTVGIGTIIPVGIGFGNTVRVSYYFIRGLYAVSQGLSFESPTVRS